MAKKEKKDFRNLQQELAVGFDRIVDALDIVSQGQQNIVEQIQQGATKEKPKKEPPIKQRNLAQKASLQAGQWLDKKASKSLTSAGRNLSRVFSRDIPRAFSKTFGLIPKAFKSITGSLKSVFSSVTSEMGEMGSFISQVFSFSVSGMMGAMFSLAKQVGVFNKMTFGAFGGLKGQHKELAQISTKTGLSMDELAGGFDKLTTEFGSGMSTVGDQLSTRMAMSAKHMKIQSGELATVSGLYGLMNDLSLEQNVTAAEHTALLAKQADVVPDQVMKDVAESGEEFAKFSKGGVKSWVSTAIEARKLGISLKTIAGSLRGMLNLEDSLTKEMQASVMLGKQVNFNDARRLALAGDTAGAFAAIQREIGDIDMTSLDPLTMEALAEATSMTALDLQKLAKGEALEKQVDPMEKMTEALQKQADSWDNNFGWMTKMEEKLAELKLMFIKQEDSGMMDPLFELTEKLFPLAIDLVRVFNKVLTAILPTINGLIKKLTDFLDSDRIDGFTDKFVELFNQLASGDFEAFWDNFLMSIKPFFKKVAEFIKPLWDGLFDNIPGGQFLKDKFDPEWISNNLDKILVAFLAFRMGLVPILWDLTKMSMNLFKWPIQKLGGKMFTSMAGKATAATAGGGGMWQALMGKSYKAGQFVGGGQRATQAGRYGGMMSKGGKLFKGFSGGGKLAMAGKASGIAGLVYEAGMLGKNIWDAVSKTGTKQKKALGGAVGGSIGAGIGFVLGGPVGAAAGAFVGRTVGEFVGKGMATGADRMVDEMQSKIETLNKQIETDEKLTSFIKGTIEATFGEIENGFEMTALNLAEHVNTLQGGTVSLQQQIASLEGSKDIGGFTELLQGMYGSNEKFATLYTKFSKEIGDGDPLTALIQAAGDLSGKFRSLVESSELWRGAEIKERKAAIATAKAESLRKQLEAGQKSGDQIYESRDAAKQMVTKMGLEGDVNQLGTYAGQIQNLITNMEYATDVRLDKALLSKIGGTKGLTAEIDSGWKATSEILNDVLTATRFLGRSSDVSKDLIAQFLNQTDSEGISQLERMFLDSKSLDITSILAAYDTHMGLKQAGYDADASMQLLDAMDDKARAQKQIEFEEKLKNNPEFMTVKPNTYSSGELSNFLTPNQDNWDNPLTAGVVETNEFQWKKSVEAIEKSNKYNEEMIDLLKTISQGIPVTKGN